MEHKEIVIKVHGREIRPKIKVVIEIECGSHEMLNGEGWNIQDFSNMDTRMVRELLGATQSVKGVHYRYPQQKNSWDK